MHKEKLKVFTLICLILPLLPSCTGSHTVSFAKDVKPILDKHCSECHTHGGQGFEASGFSIENYDSIMKGTRFGAVIHPGNSLTSSLVALVEGRANPTIRMPHGREPLSDKEIKTIKEWIDQGAKNN